ncbi:hypothetical protein K458DRAFT_406856 [Lentithecium fluviatile CBS 122367]|uniref:Uncharacterized protein n=1 Tax=Lentithecium fluviatile CBS 122367 TaxID=1168545 RepID=A0A6G1ISA0_9PLEO|nr:hypothetical protein K458DRAFT_406856 [Lentithecium fluviatile CBS 122367]
MPANGLRLLAGLAPAWGLALAQSSAGCTTDPWKLFHVPTPRVVCRGGREPGQEGGLRGQLAGCPPSAMGPLPAATAARRERKPTTSRDMCWNPASRPRLRAPYRAARLLYTGRRAAPAPPGPARGWLLLGSVPTQGPALRARSLAMCGGNVQAVGCKPSSTRACSCIRHASSAEPRRPAAEPGH